MGCHWLSWHVMYRNYRWGGKLCTQYLAMLQLFQNVAPASLGCQILICRTYTEAFHTPRVILEIVVETDALILALKARQCRNKLFGKSRYDAGPDSCFHPGWHSFKHQCLHSAWRCPESHWHLHYTYGVRTMLSIHCPSTPPTHLWSIPYIHPRTWPLG